MVAKNKLVRGVGINDADYQTSISVRVEGKLVKLWRCPFYRKWEGILARITDKSRPTYGDVWICDDWIYFSKFKAWMETQDWEGKELDKDILIEGNKIYSPEVCCFVSRKVNGFVVDTFKTKRIGRELPFGVSFNIHENNYQAHIKYGGQMTSLGCSKYPALLHLRWASAKFECLKHLIQVENLSANIANALLVKYKNILDNAEVKYQESLLAEAA